MVQALPGWLVIQIMISVRPKHPKSCSNLSSPSTPHSTNYILFIRFLISCPVLSFWDVYYQVHHCVNSPLEMNSDYPYFVFITTDGLDFRTLQMEREDNAFESADQDLDIWSRITDEMNLLLKSSNNHIPSVLSDVFYQVCKIIYIFWKIKPPSLSIGLVCFQENRQRTIAWPTRQPKPLKTYWA